MIWIMPSGIIVLFASGKIVDWTVQSRLRRSLADGVAPMNFPSEPGALGLFGTGLSQHAHLITLSTAQDSALPETLAAESFTGHEAVNDLFRFEVDALGTSTDLDLSLFLGEELTIRLLQPDGSRRAWHGMCTQAAWLGADGGLARYRLRLEPALALLGLRRDSYLFQDKNVRDMVVELLADYPQVRFDFDITQELAPRPVCTQYRESDLVFLRRLLASEGLSWRFEHDQKQDQGQGDGDGHARHRLLVSTAAPARRRRQAATASASTACARPSRTTRSTPSALVAGYARTWSPSAAGTRPNWSRRLPSTNRSSTPARCRNWRSTTAAANAMPPAAPRPTRTRN